MFFIYIFIIILFLIFLFYYFYYKKDNNNLEWNIFGHSIVNNCFNYDINFIIEESDNFSLNKLNNQYKITIDSNKNKNMIIKGLSIQIAKMISKSQKLSFLSVNEKLQLYLLHNYKINIF
jgi:hypothetical protein